MTDNNDLDALRNLFKQDQREAIEAARDRALQKCAEYTAQHYEMLVRANVPAKLVDRLTERFQAEYLRSVFEFKPLDGDE